MHVHDTGLIELKHKYFSLRKLFEQQAMRDLYSTKVEQKGFWQKNYFVWKFLKGVKVA